MVRRVCASRRASHTAPSWVVGLVAIQPPLHHPPPSGPPPQPSHRSAAAPLVPFRACLASPLILSTLLLSPYP
eukprot:11692697-Heterocapsa_arctica.AAC.1